MKYFIISLIIFFSVSAYAQTTTVKGTITDAHNNQPLPFVSVAFNGSTTGTVTDMNGK